MTLLVNHSVNYNHIRAREGDGKKEDLSPQETEAAGLPLYVSSGTCVRPLPLPTAGESGPCCWNELPQQATQEREMRLRVTRRTCSYPHIDSLNAPFCILLGLVAY